MSKAYTCRDIGMDCEWKTSGDTEGELLRLIGEHMALVHHIIDTPAELLVKVREAIRDEQ